MASINYGLYVVIKNVEEFKKTISILKELSYSNVILKFETDSTTQKNYITICEALNNNCLIVIVQMEMYSDKDKFRVLNKPERQHSMINVSVNTLFDCFKSLNNNYTIVFIMYEDYKLHINCSTTSIIKNYEFNTDEIKDFIKNINLDNIPLECTIQINNMRDINNFIKEILKDECSQLRIMCTNKDFSIASVSNDNNSVKRNITFMNNYDNEGVNIHPGNDIDFDNMVISANYNKSYFKILSKIDSQVNLSIYNYNQNYLLVICYQYNTNEWIKIVIAPYEIITKDHNDDQIEY